MMGLTNIRGLLRPRIVSLYGRYEIKQQSQTTLPRSRSKAAVTPSLYPSTPLSPSSSSAKNVALAKIPTLIAQTTYSPSEKDKKDISKQTLSDYQIQVDDSSLHWVFSYYRLQVSSSQYSNSPKYTLISHSNATQTKTEWESLIPIFGLQCIKKRNFASSEIIWLANAKPMDALLLYESYDRRYPVLLLPSVASEKETDDHLVNFLKHSGTRSHVLWTVLSSEQGSLDENQALTQLVWLLDPHQKIKLLSSPTLPQSSSPSLVAEQTGSMHPRSPSPILQYGSLKPHVWRQFRDAERLAGIPSLSLPGLTRILKGFRRGELTILTGPTGTGKTNLLSQLSLDYCSQGVPTIWCSFEIPAPRLIAGMMLQYSAGKLQSMSSTKAASSQSSQAVQAETWQQWSDSFERLPMYFLNYFGSTSLTTVLEGLRSAVETHDVHHVILDNLQFMLSGQTKSGSNFEKYDMMETAISKLRDFSTQTQTHISLVIHPRKEPDGVELGLSSVLGTGKSTQEADNVLVLQKDVNDRRWIDIKKNRWDGTLGKIHYSFDPLSKRIYENQSKMEKKSPVGNLPHESVKQENDTLTEDQLSEMDSDLLEKEYS